MSQQQPFPSDEQSPAQNRTPYRPKTGQQQRQVNQQRPQAGRKPVTESPLKQRPKTARQVKEEQSKMQRDLLASKASEKHAFTDKDAEIEHLKSELEIYKQRAAIVDDMKDQNQTLQTQLDASYKTNEQQLKVNEQQGQLIIAQAQQIQALQEEKGMLSEQVVELEGLRTENQKQMLASVQYMEELENRVYETNQVGLQLLTQIRDQTEEIETLKVYCMDLKSKVSVYIPIKEDAVDNRLADYINNYPDRTKLKVMFLRESAGVYEFGTKRVEVRVAKGKITVRVGGGYMGIDEFLDQYTTIELEKLERRDPLKKFAEKVALNKTVQGREVSIVN